MPGLTGGLVALGLLFVMFAGFIVVDTVRETQADRAVAGFQGAGQGADRAVAGEQAALRYHVDRTSEDGIGVQTLVRTPRRALEPVRRPAPPGAAVRVAALDLETDKPMFTTEAPPAGKRFAWDLVYWDGVEYETTIAAAGPGIAPVSRHLELTVGRAGAPAGGQVRELVWLLTPLIAGMGWACCWRGAAGAGRPGRARPHLDPATAGGAR